MFVFYLIVYNEIVSCCKIKHIRNLNAKTDEVIIVFIPSGGGGAVLRHPST
jgi:hypothetical protein